MSDGWKKKFKGDRVRGGAWIHTHPKVAHAIVQSRNGVSFDGKVYGSLEEAKEAALKNSGMIYEEWGF